MKDCLFGMLSIGALAGVLKYIIPSAKENEKLLEMISALSMIALLFGSVFSFGKTEVGGTVTLPGTDFPPQQSASDIALEISKGAAEKEIERMILRDLRLVGTELSAEIITSGEESVEKIALTLYCEQDEVLEKRLEGYVSLKFGCRAEIRFICKNILEG